MKVSAYKTAKKEGLFLFVPQGQDLADLPEALKVFFGEALHVIDFELTEDRKLAQEDTQEVLANLQSQGYHLQMPPTEEQKRALEAAEANIQA